jgi:imidazolonepropionase-like amidohydrolase/pimeloyl-ACP methyl ester carboxylesterase
MRNKRNNHEITRNTTKRDCAIRVDPCGFVVRVFRSLAVFGPGLFLFAALAISAQVKPLDARVTAFVGVNVIPMDKERILTDQTVIVRDGSIAEIGPAGKIKVPKGANKIDGKGKYLIPGLTDMHAHLLSDDHLPDSLAPDELKIIVANGVTTIRLMIGTPGHLKLRRQSAAGEITAPTIYAASPQFSGRSFGDPFNGYVVTNGEQARESVRKARADGYDFIKLTFFISREVYDAVIDEAAKQNMRVIGHVDRQVGLKRAFEAGQQIEHLDGFFEAMIPPEAKLPGSTSGVYVWQPKAWESLDVLDEKRIPVLAAESVKANPFSCPTLTFLKSSFGAGSTDEQVKARPGYRFYPPKIREELDEPRHIFWKNPPAAERRAKYVDYRNKITKAIFDAGGKILAGSDSPDWLLLYGFSLHTEIKNLTEAGLSNYAALEAATRNPADFFGALATSGTVEKGKRGDLVLLNANPLENISATENRAGVMLKGKWFPQAELNGWLDDIAARFQKTEPETPSSPAALAGYWEGDVTREGKTWRVNLDVVPQRGGQLKALVDFVDLAAVEREFTVTSTGDAITLRRAQPNGSAIVFEGAISGGSFKGKFTGLGTTADFSLRMGKKPEKFYREEEVSFKNGDVALSGTLLLPPGKSKTAAVIFTHGSGPDSRAPYKDWALRFVKRGVAALIYDKRGVGKSTGEWRSASMEDLADDAIAGLNLLKTRAEIDTAHIGIAGHSQGGWIAPLAASRSKDAAFVITSAASGVGPDKQSIYHRAGVLRGLGFSEDAVAKATELREKLYASGRLLLNNDPGAKEERAKVSAELEKYAKEPWFEASELPPDLKEDNPSHGALELLFFEPGPMWQKVKVPVFLAWGDQDKVVPVEEGKSIIQKALIFGGNQDVTVRIFPGVDHGVAMVRPKDAPWDFPRSDASYYDTMAEWLVNKLKT